MSKVATRIQSRLTRKGIKVTLGDIKDVLIQTTIDADNPTDSEIDSIVEHFVNQFSKPVAQEQETPLETVLDDNVVTTLEEEKELEEEVEQQAMPTALNYALDEDDYSDEDKRALTVQKSQELGITLSDTEINLIADSIEQCGESLDELLDGIQSALVAYINHKTSQNTKKIDSALDAVVDYAEQKFSDNSQHLSNRLIKLGSEMEAVATRNKSQIKSILSRLTVPSS